MVQGLARLVARDNCRHGVPFLDTSAGIGDITLVGNKIGVTGLEA